MKLIRPIDLMVIIAVTFAIGFCTSLLVFSDTLAENSPLLTLGLSCAILSLIVARIVLKVLKSNKG
ncbi:hypothetical protein KEM09_09020 [Carboxylicivirga mesophila]|uniref:Uncharacterized protein n=1 Tax=Carboxylicivirga mesophila TaxID=1166478 RepID=A0ABS5K992_9BACT|nr:hypothetical protein [Carboxylicivirga mesophila]MBS2211541.1 hypothetical protein [Carboxylicivirga mesophila]